MFRIVLVLGVSLLAGCAGQTPASLGLTGATAAKPPPPPSDADLGFPGIGQGSQRFAPSLVPQTGPNGSYFGSD